VGFRVFVSVAVGYSIRGYTRQLGYPPKSIRASIRRPARVSVSVSAWARVSVAIPAYIQGQIPERGCILQSLPKRGRLQKGAVSARASREKHSHVWLRECRGCVGTKQEGKSAVFHFLSSPRAAPYAAAGTRAPRLTNGSVKAYRTRTHRLLMPPVCCKDTDYLRC
jgi:hypothetical protein